MSFLASLDGAIAPVEQTQIPVSDEGLLRGDGGFEVTRLYGGRPFALEDHFARLERTCAGIRLRGRPRGAAARGRRAARAHRRRRRAAAARRHARRAAAGHDRAAPGRPDSVRMATVTYAPTRVLNGLKTLSYAREHAGRPAGQGAGRRRGAARHAARPRARGADGDVLLGRGRPPATPPLEDGILASITRDRLLAECDVEEAPCTLDDVRAADEAFIASSVREVHAGRPRSTTSSSRTRRGR